MRVDRTQAQWVFIIKLIGNKMTSSSNLYVSQPLSNFSMWNHTWVIFPTLPSHVSLFLVGRERHSFQTHVILFNGRPRFFVSSWSETVSSNAMLNLSWELIAHKPIEFILKPIGNKRCSHQAYMLVHLSNFSMWDYIWFIFPAQESKISSSSTDMARLSTTRQQNKV